MEQAVKEKKKLTTKQIEQRNAYLFLSPYTEAISGMAIPKSTPSILFLSRVLFSNLSNA